MNMTELALEYRRSAEALAGRIQELRLEVGKMEPHRRWSDFPEAYRRLELLLRERDELLLAARQMEEYYAEQPPVWEECS